MPKTIITVKHIIKTLLLSIKSPLKDEIQFNHDKIKIKIKKVKK